ncbi:hypothetical protein L1049_007017 [Liquidambar formosana]|uniref:Eukaryotic translation initiation factor 3 subunit D n=1 Tax=Liquidambar formosana TaxID=63359 RepID=A0AAP0RI28_LIQFO
MYNNDHGSNMLRREAVAFKSSADIQPEWNMLDQIPFSTFLKLSFSVPELEDLLLHGGLDFYDWMYDHVTLKNEGRLKRYRRWKLDDEMYLVARCEVQSVVEVNKQRSFLTLNALNEFDLKYSGVDWRQKLETQRGTILATGLKNNANKLAKWTTQALLASADLMKLVYVSRVHPRDHFNHVILAVVGYKLREFAAQINVNTSNMWGIIKPIVDFCMKLNKGKYILVKDPSKPQVRIYEVPADAFKNDYMEEPLPKDEQVQSRAEDASGGEASAVATDVEQMEATAKA